MAETKAKRLWPLALVIAVALAAVWMLPTGQWLKHLQHPIESLGPLAPIVYALVYIATTVLLVPGSVLTLGAAALFGFWRGFAVVFVGANLGALCAFWLARTFWRERVAQWAAAQPKFAALDRAIGREGFKMVLLSRLSPVFPFTLLNYFLGLTTVRVGSYVAANVIGMLPGTFLYVYLGATARDVIGATSGSVGKWRLALQIVGLLATVAVVVWITRVAKRAMAQAEKENPEESSELNAQGV